MLTIDFLSSLQAASSFYCPQAIGGGRGSSTCSSTIRNIQSDRQDYLGSQNCHRDMNSCTPVYHWPRTTHMHTHNDDNIIQYCISAPWSVCSFDDMTHHRSQQHSIMVLSHPQQSQNCLGQGSILPGSRQRQFLSSVLFVMILSLSVLNVVDFNVVVLLQILVSAHKQFSWAANIND